MICSSVVEGSVCASVAALHQTRLDGCLLRAKRDCVANKKKKITVIKEKHAKKKGSYN